MPYFKGRIFSGHEMARSKPAPDVYLAAAGRWAWIRARCAVVEDTVTGVTAGVAAGATVFGYSPPEAGHDAPGRCAGRRGRDLHRHGAAARAAGVSATPALPAQAVISGLSSSTGTIPWSPSS